MNRYVVHVRTFSSEYMPSPKWKCAYISYGPQNQSEQSEAVKMVKCAQTVRNRKKSF